MKFYDRLLPNLKHVCKSKAHMNNELVKTDLETTEIYLKIFKQRTFCKLYQNSTFDATLKAILKYRNHPSIIAIQNKYKDKHLFNFTEVDQKQIEKEILKLGVNKASQSSDIPIKLYVFIMSSTRFTVNPHSIFA